MANCKMCYLYEISKVCRPPENQHAGPCDRYQNTDIAFKNMAATEERRREQKAFLSDPY